MPRRVVIAGASGLIGTALTESLRRDGVDVVPIVGRSLTSPLDPGALEGATAVVNLAGASVGRLPWTKLYRGELWNSRIQTTRTLATAIRELGSTAPAFLCASAVGFYGHRPGETLTEASGAGDTFLATLSAAWEQEASTAGKHSRIAFLRTAPVLHPRGFLRPMITLTRFGLGGPLGGGRQVWPWISLGDEVRAIRHIIDSDISGPVNLVSPVRATANDIGKSLARHLRRPFLIPAPAWALRLGLGRDAADSLILSDAHVVPDVLESSGFRFEERSFEETIASF